MSLRPASLLSEAAGMSSLPVGSTSKGSKERVKDRQTETDRYRQKQTETDRETERQADTYRNSSPPGTISLLERKKERKKERHLGVGQA